MITIGRNLLTAENEVKFAALDFDSHDPITRQAVLMAKRTLAHFTIPSFIEWSGRKGFHLLVPFADFLPASKGQRLLYGVLAALPLSEWPVMRNVFRRYV